MSNELSNLVEDIAFMEGVKKDLSANEMAELDIALRAVNSSIESMKKRLDDLKNNA